MSKIQNGAGRANYNMVGPSLIAPVRSRKFIARLGFRRPPTGIPGGLVGIVHFFSQCVRFLLFSDKLLQTEF